MTLEIYPPLCYLPDSLADQVENKWVHVGTSNNPLLWSILAIPGLTEVQVRTAYGQAWQQWMAVCGIVAKYTDTARSAHVKMGAGSIDGRNGTLAWSELPNGGDLPLQQKYDTSEMWGIFDQQVSGQIDLVRVACHEIGHALGLGHDDRGSEALMAPIYSPTIRAPTQRDIRRIQVLYGPPQAPPIPPIPPPGSYNFEQACNLICETLSNTAGLEWEVRKK